MPNNFQPNLSLLILQKTLDWHHAWRTDEGMQTVTLEQIADYQSTGKTTNYVFTL